MFFQHYFFNWALFMALLFTPMGAWAFSSFKLAHPVGWMHQLPGGEMPGWSHEFWVNVELAHSNIWNAPLELTHLDTGETLEFFADFEQTHLSISLGKSLGESFAISLELPVVSQSSGFMDQFIDDFHTFIGSSRFERHKYPNNKHNFKISTDGINFLDGQSLTSGIHQVVVKNKWWLWKKIENPSCQCGFSLSSQIKLPIAKATTGGTSGSIDGSLLWHIGFPLLESSSVWLTSAVTHTGKNKAMTTWPTRTWHQMYEISTSFAWSDTTSIIFQLRSESPILNIENVQYENSTGDAELYVKQRVASGYNSLVRWRGSQALGLRLKREEGAYYNFMIIEDWNFGRFDHKNENVYVNNAPDVSFLFQWNFGL